MNKPPDIVYFNDAVHVLRISDRELYILIKSRNIQLSNSEMGPAISKDDFLSLAYSSDIIPSIQKTLQFESSRRQKDKISGADSHFNEDSAQKLIKYRAYVGTIEAIHANRQ